jgi:uncharacterized membrane protein HdeD (DUF308 family)
VSKKLNNWWLLTIAGIILICLGAFALISPLNAYLMLIQYAGFTILLNGLFLVVVAYGPRGTLREKEWLITESVVDFAFGAVLLFNSFLSLLAFPFLFGSWIMGKGLLKIVAALTLRKTIGGWLIVLAMGVLFIVFGVLIMYNPLPVKSGIALFIGLFAVLLGIIYLFDSFRYRKTETSIDLMY